MLNAEGVQFPNRYAFNSVMHNITDVGLKVKPQTETLQFKKWFEDSKVVDESGKPLVVYHGSDADFYSFNTTNGAWFSRDYDYAESMAEERGGGRVKSYYLSIKNPMTVKVSPKQFASDTALEKRLIAEAKKNGHDGLIIENDTTNELEKDTFYVAFQPEQIKSATDNIGTFDRSNPDVRFSLAQYSEEDQRDIVAVLKPFVGTYIQKDKEDYQAYLKSKGIDVSLKDAWSFALEAAHQARSDSVKRSRQRRDAWLYENVPLYREAVDFAGENFMIKPSGLQYY